MVEELRDLLGELEKKPHTQSLALSIRFGLRDVFDYCCAEWKYTTMGDKQALLSLFEDAGISRERLKSAFKQTYTRLNRPDIVQLADVSLRAVELGDVIKAVQEEQKNARKKRSY